MPRPAKKVSAPKDSSAHLGFEAKLWLAADKLRNNMDAANYKCVVLGLIKGEQEILRPTFALREKPLANVCGFISFSKLMEKLNGIRKLGLATSLKSDFLQKTAEYFGEDEEA